MVFSSDAGSTPAISTERSCRDAAGAFAFSTYCNSNAKVVIYSPMKMRLHFTKMSGAGNDFVVMNNMDGEIQCDKRALAVALCAQHTGIGADGLLVLEHSANADFFMAYYNADGSYGGMCGNGGRCAARYAYVSGITGPQMIFEALDYRYTAHVIADAVKLHMRNPTRLQQGIKVSDSSLNVEGDFIDTGSPHFVTEQETLDRVDVAAIGRRIRFHPAFSPEGCNVNFIQRLRDNVAAIRTYERGVEAETLACGTGCVAAAIVLALHHRMQSPIALRVRSGEEMRVHFRQEGERFSDIVLEGSAHFVFSGTVLYDPETRAIIDSPEILSYIDRIPS